VLLALAGFVVGVYVVVVVGGGAVTGRTESPSLPLSVLATAVVALLFAPVQTALERLASSRGHGGADTPYDVLSRFSETVTSGYPSEDLPGRMSMLLAQGTGAAWAQVWLTVSDRLALAATWPGDAEADRKQPDPLPSAWMPPARVAAPLRYGTTASCSACCAAGTTRPSAHVGRGAAVHRPGRTGRADAPARRAAGGAGTAVTRSSGPGQRS
jgi:hypothetical protein